MKYSPFPSSSNIIINMLIESSKKLNLSIESLLATLPNESRQNASEKVRLPLDAITTVWQWFTEHGQDENIGLRLADATPLTSQTMLTYLVMSCKTFEDVMDVIVKYQWFICDGGLVSVKKVAQECHMEFEFSVCTNQEFRHQAEYAMLLMHHWLEDLLGQAWHIQEINFTHPEPNDISLHKALFDCDLKFSAQKNVLKFDTSLLSHSIRYANEELNSILQEQAQSLKSYIEQREVIVVACQFIKEHLGSGNVVLEEVAKHCQLSARQLKHLFEQQGTNFRELIEQEKVALAQSLLADNELSIAQVSDACGFAEPSIFNRAVKRWFGVTPSQFRQRLKEEVC